MLPILKEKYGETRVIGVSSKQYDLTNALQVEKMFEAHRPDTLVHLAGYSGGIAANRKYPADFFFRNIQLITLGFDAARKFGVSKVLYPAAGCGYPAQPGALTEEMMWSGYPQPDNAAYAFAKKMGVVAAEAYQKQYGLNSVVIVPGNMYGEYDNFIYDQSHVIPALIRRFIEAQGSGCESVNLWGTGRPIRNFVYAGDVARLIPYFLESYEGSCPVNLSSEESISIRDLSLMIIELVGYRGKIQWDETKPDGQMEKVFSVSRLKSLNQSCPTQLATGLIKTIQWFRENYAERTDGIRL